jgi:hypothetical protein
MTSANDVEQLMAALSAKNAVIEVQKETIRQLREQLGGRSLHVIAKAAEPAKAVKAAEPVKTAEPAKAAEPVKTAEPVEAAEPSRHVTPRKAKIADYELAAGPKAVAMATFKGYAKGPMTKNAFFYQAVAYLRSVCENGVDEHRRAMDALVAHHGEGSTIDLTSKEVETGKFVVSFDTWETLFKAAGFVQGKYADYAPVHELAKLPAKSSKTKSSATKSTTTATEASVSRPLKVVPRSAAA